MSLLKTSDEKVKTELTQIKTQLVVKDSVINATKKELNDLKEKHDSEVKELFENKDTYKFVE